MPLSQLFHKRYSLKNKTEAPLPPTQENVIAEPKELHREEPDDCVDGSEQIENIPSKDPTGCGLEKTEDISSKVESDESSIQQDPSYRKSSASSEDSQHGLLPEKASIPKANRSKNRSVSFKETRSVSFKGGRKKCDSESSVINSSTDDEGFDDKVLYLKERDLELVIEQRVGRMIRESIATAVRSVNFDNLYEEVMKGIHSERSQSESSDVCPSTIEQKLHTKSVTEYVDLDEDHVFDDEELPYCETIITSEDYTTSEDSSHDAGDKKIRTDSNDLSEKDCSSQQRDPNSTNENEVKRNNDFSDGYQADVEESEGYLSIPSGASSDDLKILNETTAEETGSDNLKVLKVPTDEEASSDKLKVLKASTAENTSSDNLKSFNGTTVEDSSSSDGKVLKAHTAEETIFDDLEVQKKTSSDDLKVPKETSSDDLKVPNEIPTKEPNAIDSISAVVKDEKRGYERENIQSESKELDDVESNSADEYERKDTLKAPEFEDLIFMSVEDGDKPQLKTGRKSLIDEPSSLDDLGKNLPEQQQSSADEEKKINWKMGYLQVKLPHKTRGKGHLKAWKKRCVAIQPDEFVHDPNNPCLMISVYSAESGTARKHSATFWKSVSGKNAIVYRSNSRTHRYAFTVSEDNKAVVHLAADSEAVTQEWMAAIRAILWPPSPVVQLEKMLKGSEFEISIIDNDFSYHAGLLGMYGYLTITPKKLILVHPQQGYVIQEWYLNTVDKFQLMHQTRIEDVHKVLAMTTCSDSSTGKGEILIFCTEAVTLLQSLAATIHQLLAYHSTQEGGIYQKELEQIAEWLEMSYTTDINAPAEDYYKVPPRQVKSLLDIPNFIFDKPLTPVASVACGTGVAMDIPKPSLETAKNTDSKDSGISAGNAADDFLNCSITSFVVGGGAFPGKSSDSELSDSYTPPQSPAVKTKRDESKLAADT